VVALWFITLLTNKLYTNSQEIYVRYPIFFAGLIVLMVIFLFSLPTVSNKPEQALAIGFLIDQDGGVLYLPLTIKEPYATSTPSPTQPPGPTVTPTPTSTLVPPDDMIWVDSRSVALFDHIPELYLSSARNLPMLFSDRSVGQNISEGLNCLTATSWSAAPAHCRRDYTDTNWNWKTFTQTDLDQGLVPDEILFMPDPTRYSRSNWTFEFRMGTWYELTQDFVQNLAPAYINSKDVLSYQFSYLNVGGGEPIDIIDPQVGYFSHNPALFTIHDLEAYMAQHSNKVFIFWTTSLARGIGTQTSTDFNNMMRQYALDHSKILFDVADILSHRPDGTPCFDNRDGIEYCSMSGQCENYPDDGLDLPAICQEYTTETDGGHLGSVSPGKIRVAKAFWVLMAQIAGWEPPSN
jgi:hypothetical protein